MLSQEALSESVHNLLKSFVSQQIHLSFGLAIQTFSMNKHHHKKKKIKSLQMSQYQSVYQASLASKTASELITCQFTALLCSKHQYIEYLRLTDRKKERALR